MTPISNQPNAADYALQCCHVLADVFASAGITDVAYGGGSRSTPIVLAFARHGAFRLHPHADERSAGFFALGAARAGRRPAVVITTSGTAAANLYPAIIEGFYGCVGLIALTADRPPELHGVGAPQTIDQTDLFGRMVRLFAQPSPPAASDSPAWHAMAHNALRAAQDGPVHLNLPLREPLVPTSQPRSIPPSAPHEAAMAISPGAATASDVHTLAEFINSTERGLVVVGSMDATDATAASILELSAAAGWPVLAEAASGVRRPGALDAPEALARVMDDAPDAVVQFGPVALSRPMRDLSSRAPRVITVAPDSPDPQRRALAHLHSPALTLAGAVRPLVNRGSTAWTTHWDTAGQHAAAACDRVLDEAPDQAEQVVMRTLVREIGDSATLVIAASMAVRHLDAILHPRDGLRVIFNRGTNGIDGFVSTACGVAAVLGPVTAVCGDLAAIHDAGALLWHRGKADIVVINNSGGGIFSYLEQSALGSELALCATPHEIDLAPLGVKQVRTDVDVTRAVYDAMWQAARAATSS